ncbi:putative oxidoreductase YjmC [Mytilus galloprovincialis]|uniref:putative oxidoreductase YjmC n=1 Tax=Mytilus galloprovincialis TaxID=29158 RepID=UPI003F7BF993
MEGFEIVIPKDNVHNFIVSSLEAVGLTPARGSLVADILVSADYRGIYSHGVILLDKYMDEIRSGVVSVEDKEPTVIKESIGTALVDGNSLIGDIVVNKCAYVARYCMDIAIKKAKEAGIGFVTCRGANHFGMAGWYSTYAMEQGFVGVALCNTNSRMVPTRGTRTTLGTNPISIAALGNHGDSFILDMATTVVAAGKLKIMASKHSILPENMIVDVNGHESRKYEDFNGVFPVGGREETGGYKGFGLAMMIDILSGVLSGAEFGANCKGAGNLELTQLRNLMTYVNEYTSC